VATREDSLPKRIRRFADVTANMGNLAARLAGERYLGIGIDREAHADDLRKALGGLKGPIMKVAQFLATIPDAIPAEYADALATLQSNAPSMGWPFVRRRMAAELGPDWRSKFADFEQVAIAAASLGQVHRAKTLDGRAIAAKLQYPDMDAAVESDLSQLSMLFSLHRRMDSAIDTANIQTEIFARLREELDYTLEARHIALYRIIFDDDSGVHVPEVIPDLSTARLLCMTWLDGAPFMSKIAAPLDERNQIAVNMFKAWWLPVSHYGVIHGDPHLGNYTIRADCSVNLLDYGLIRTFTPRFVQGVIDLYRAVERGDQELEVHAYETWGFRTMSKELIETLNIWAKFIYGPMLDNRVRTIADGISPGDYGRREAGEVHARLRALGPVLPSREFAIMDRAAIGLGGVFLHLQAQANWYRLFNDTIDGFDQDTLARRQADAFNRAGVPAAA
jgi:predicted unusual protein kinase regulating ubiquinone biosynthesis (AarF/ABC1/UbiB family)